MSDDEGDRAPNANDIEIEDVSKLRATVAAGSILNTRKAGSQVWLVKIPEFVAEKWKEVGATPGEMLGKLRVQQSRLNPANRTISLHLPDGAEWAAELPKNYKLHMSNDPKGIYVFNQDQTSGLAREVAGRVHHEATLIPEHDAQYRDIIKKRQESASLKRKNIVQISERDAKKNAKVHAANYAVETGIPLGNAPKKTGGASLDKRERLPRDELITLIFEAFSEFQYWTFKSLQERTDQPQAWLKEVIGDLLVLNKSGPYHGHYSLKPEFAKIDAAVRGAKGESSGVKSDILKEEADDEGMDDDDDDDEEFADLV